MTTFAILDDGASKKGGFHCYKIVGSAEEVAAAYEFVKGVSGTRYVQTCTIKGVEDVTFEADSKAIDRIRAKLQPKVRRIVSANTSADAMGAGFDGFGKTWTISDEDACVHGFQPGADYAVKYAYFLA